MRDETSNAVSRTRNFRDASAPRSPTAFVISAGLLDRVSSLPPREIDPGSSRARAGRTQGRAHGGSALPDATVSGVEGLAARGVRVVLRRLAAVVFPVAAHDPYAPDPRLVI